MRNWARFGVLAAVLIGATGLAGCHHTQNDFAATHFMAAEPIIAERVRSAPRVRARAKATRSAVAAIGKPIPVAAGAKIRQFCGQRHIRFQTGKLQESTHEKARNNELCRQEYKG